MTNENAKTKNERTQIRVNLNGFFFCCSFGSFLNFDLYFYFLIFNFYIYRFWQKICYIDLIPCCLYGVDTYNKGGLR
jgi:hypothetical protein